jgi:HemY protein
MRGVIWLVLLFVAAVVAALTLGDNDGLVSFFWGTRRVDMSLNLFLLVALAAVLALVAGLQALNALLSLPRRAREWRELKRERAAQSALREALSEFFGARYSRAHRAALRALSIQDAAGVLREDPEFSVQAHLLAAGSLHRLQDRPRRDEQLQLALDRVRGNARAVGDGARLLGAEWALEDRNVERAEGLLRELPPGTARRTQALRLRLQLARLARQPLEALHTARLLAKHQAFSRSAAQGLLRSLAAEVLDGAHDADQLRRTWGQMDSADRRDPVVVAHGARRAVALGVPEDARQWLRPFWDALGDVGSDERTELALALSLACPGIGPEWLPRLEAAQSAWVSEPAVQAAVGHAFAARGLWGKARRPLENAARHPELDSAARRHAWRALAALAREQGDEQRALDCERAGAELD